MLTKPPKLGSSSLKRLFTAVWLVGCVCQGVIRRPYARRHEQATVLERRAGPAELVGVGALGIGWGVLPLVDAATPWLRRFDWRAREPWKAAAGAAGSALLGGGLYLFWRAHRDLDDNWSPTLEVAAGQRLVTTGVYERVRHPMYTSALLMAAGQGLLLQNAVAGPAGLLGFATLYLLRVRSEERMLVDAFGPAYARYCARTGRLFPRRG